MASNLGPNPSAADVEDEIVFVETRLESLDPDSSSFMADRQELQDELTALEMMLGDLQQDAASQQQHSTPMHNRTMLPDSFATAAASASWDASPTLSQETSPPATHDASLNHGSPLAHRLRTYQATPERARPRSSLMPPAPTMSRKRPLGASHLTSEARHSKSQRTTPNISDAEDSDDSLDLAAEALFHGSSTDPARVAAMMEKQRKLLADAEALAAQKKRDEVMARQLEMDSAVAPGPSGQRAPPTAQAVFRPDGSFQKPGASSKPPTASPYLDLGPSFAGQQQMPEMQSPYSTPVRAGPSAQPTGFAQYAGLPAFGQASNSTFGYGYPQPYVNPESLQLPYANSFQQQPYSTGFQQQPYSNGFQQQPFFKAEPNQFHRQQNQTHPVRNLQDYMPPGASSDSEFEEISRQTFEASPTRKKPSVGSMPGVFPQNPGRPQDAMFPNRDMPPAKGSFAQQAMHGARNIVGQGTSGLYNPFDGGMYGSSGHGGSTPTHIGGPSYGPHGLSAFSVLPRSSYNRPVVIDDDDEDIYGMHAQYSHVRDRTAADRLEQELKLAENIRPDEDIAPEEREPTPHALAGDLYEHQKLALSWMKRMEEGATRGGILADDMGLGKTIEALALMVARPSENPRCKTTLIIAPVALMRQWQSEIKSKLKPGPHQMNVWVHHGPKKKRSFHDLRQYDVVLTTFGTLASEMTKLNRWRERARSQRDLPPPQGLPLIAGDAKWYRVIIDEAQCIRNKSTKTSGATCELKAEYRWCMTGTPMMNGLKDIYGLIRFLKVEPYNDWNSFRVAFAIDDKRNWTDRRREEGMRKFQAMLKAILLRRTKDSKIDGENIVKLPQKHIEQESVEFDDAERELYTALEGKTQLTINRYLREGTVMQHYSNVLVLLLRLRQACCHPHLIKDLDQPTNVAGIPEEERIDFASKLPDDVVKRVIEETKNGALECPICLDGSANPTILYPCGHGFCGECFTRITSPEEGIQQGDENGQTKCPLCRGLADAKKAIDFDTFKKIHQRELWNMQHADDEEEGDGPAESDDGSDTMSELDDDESGSETESLNGFIVDDDVETDEDEASERAEAPRKSKKKGKKQKSKQSQFMRKGKGKERKKTRKVTLADLRKAGLRNKKARAAFLRRLRKDYVESSKITRCLKILDEIEQNDPKEKTIIFSQFTTMLDLVEIPIFDKGIRYERYDGSMNSNARAEAVANFMDKNEIKVMLVSLKAGNAGLNLTSASQVIMLDPFWNPYIEMQAVDRCYRIGQRREVHVHNTLVPDTVEDRIIELQKRKKEVISTALDENAGKSISRLSVNQIRFLFGLGGSANG